MGKTVPSYRMALEDEIARWKPFRSALHDIDAVEAFDEMMDACRNHASAGGCACNPILFEPMVMSILLEQQLRIKELESKFHDAFWKKFCLEEQKTGTT